MLDSVFNKVAGLQLSSEYCEILKTSFFHEKPPVAASEIFINFSGEQQKQRRKIYWIRCYVNILLTVVDILDFLINQSITKQFKSLVAET